MVFACFFVQNDQTLAFSFISSLRKLLAKDSDEVPSGRRSGNAAYFGGCLESVSLPFFVVFLLSVCVLSCFLVFSFAFLCSVVLVLGGDMGCMFPFGSSCAKQGDSFNKPNCTFYAVLVQSVLILATHL